MTNFFDHGDDLSDFLGGPTLQAAPKSLPEGDAFARIRDMADQAPVAPTFKVPCQKCGGSGRWQGSYKSGPCYTCKGKGHFVRKSSPQQLAANREKAADRKARGEKANWDLFVETFPAHAQVLTRGANSNNPSWSNTCVDIMGKVRKYGDLHQGTMDMLGRAVARDQEWAAQRAQEAVQQQERVAGVDVANIVDCFQRASEAGLKRFSLRFNGVHFEADKREAGLIWISEKGYGSAKYGLIKGGVYKPGRDVTDAIIAQIAEISRDPMAAAKAYVQITNHCSVCGRFLQNQDSVDAGMGPVCAGRINRPGLKFVEVKEGDF